jgi:hypothetical protein
MNVKNLSRGHCFRRIATGLDTAPLLAALDANSHLWDVETRRQDMTGSPHKDTEAVYIRWGKTFDVERVLENVYEIEGTPEANELCPGLNQVLTPVDDLLGHPALGRIIIAKLEPVGHIDAHVDSGRYADFYDRFHLVLSASPGNEFTVGPHTFGGAPGELWWFNHKLTHEVFNWSNKPRIHMIIDAMVPAYRIIRNEALELAA